MISSIKQNILTSMTESLLKKKRYVRLLLVEGGRGGDRFRGMESKPPAAWLGRKDNMPVVSEFVIIFILQIGGWGT